jgi:hypothetical protein
VRNGPEQNPPPDSSHESASSLEALDCAAKYVSRTRLDVLYCTAKYLSQSFSLPGLHKYRDVRLYTRHSTDRPECLHRRLTAQDQDASLRSRASNTV